MPAVYRSLAEIPLDVPESAITIGNFDGVHLGHRHLFERIVEVGRERGWTPSVLTFNPHPTRVVAPDRAPRLLTTPEQRFEWMGEAGIEQVFLLPFDRPFSELTPEQFVTRILLDRLHARAVLVGDNFRFGNRQAGDVALLRQLGQQYGIYVEVVPGIAVRGRTVSSTAVRGLILSGNVAMAYRLLGHPFALEGDVVSGHGIGSKQTVPTLNLRTDAEILPANGVYVTRTTSLDDGRAWPSITNIGCRPTFDGDALTVETYLLPGVVDPRPSTIRVEFIYRLRDERKFPSPEELKRQIMRDVERARIFHRRLARAQSLRSG